MAVALHLWHPKAAPRRTPSWDLSARRARGRPSRIDHTTPYRHFEFAQGSKVLLGLLRSAEEESKQRTYWHEGMANIIWARIPFVQLCDACGKQI